MTPRELAGEATNRVRRRLNQSLRRASDNPHSTSVSSAQLRRAFGQNAFSDLTERIRASDTRRLVPGFDNLDSTVDAVNNLFPSAIEQSRREAEDILDHRITLFGRVFDCGRKIDWHRDPNVSQSWPLKHYTRVPLSIGGGADVRLVWELNRLQHLLILGRAYLLTNDERYSEEFLLQLTSWHDENPPRFGVNWAVAMEVGIRAVNIIAALEMFRRSPILSDDAIELVIKMLLEHGRFIRRNLEFSYRTNSNHYLSNLIGLFAIGETVPELREARGWRDYSGQRLVKEMTSQVLTDGVDYELSIGYHRFVLEIFLLFLALCRRGSFDPGAAFVERLEAMFEFVHSYLKPDNTAPLIGDSDDGRLIRFKERPAADHSYLLSIGAILFSRFKSSENIDEEAIWWFGREALDGFASLPIKKREHESQAFPEAQVFIQRSGDNYSIIDCGDHGARGRGSHAHSDALSIEVFALNRTFLRDPGTYCYTASEEQRNLFRSTAYHNTVRVDGQEISVVNDGELFAFASNVRPRVNSWESTSERDVLDAEHYAYRRLARPVTHRRVVTFDKHEGNWSIRDIFSGEGRHLFEFFFNFDAGLEVTVDEANRAQARDEKLEFTIIPRCDHALDAVIEPRWISPAYGTRLNSSAIIYSLTCEVPLDLSFLLQASKIQDARL